MIEDVLHSWIEEACEDLNDLPKIKVYPVHIPQDPLKQRFPCVSYNQTTNGDEYDLQEAFEWVHPQFNIHVWANQFRPTSVIAKAIRDTINNYQGVVGTTYIMHVAINNIGDMPIERGSDINIYHRVINAEIWYRSVGRSFSSAFSPAFS